MQISDVNNGVQVLYRKGRVVEYLGDVARYGEVANHFGGGACWSMAWTPGTLRVQRREKDAPKAARRHSKFWHKDDPLLIGINGEEMEFRPDDITVCMTEDERQPTGALTMMMENYIYQIKLPTDNVPPSPSDSTFPPPVRPSPL